MAPELGWDQARTVAEIRRFHEMIAADLAAEAMPDELTAYQAATGRSPDMSSGPWGPITSVRSD